VSVYDLYQSYLNAQKQVAPSLGILDPRLLYPQNYQGSGDGPRGGGDFGNLDMSRGKEVTRDVYQDVLGPPGAFEFSPQTMMAYPNLSSGLYQTYEGKNVDGLLSNTGATFGLAGLAMKMMGMQPKTVGGFVPGSIRGKFDTIGDVFNYITGKDRREAKAAQEAAQQDVLEKTNAARINAQQYTGGGGGGGRGNIGSDGADYSGSAQTGAKGGFGYGL
jgi:hypothetical protein